MPLTTGGFQLLYNAFTTASNWKEHIGTAFKDVRKNVIIDTKFGNVMGDDPNTTGASHHHITQQVEGSLRALQTDYIDL